MFDFPDAPTPGQNYQGYIWDGEKWTTPVAAATTSGYVLKGGDVMSGNLTISKPNAALTLDTTDAGQVVSYMARKGKLRWFQYTQNDAESGGNAGSSFGIGRCNDAGAYIDSPLTISRADGRVSLTNAPLSPNHAVNKLYVDAAGNTKINRDRRHHGRPAEHARRRPLDLRQPGRRRLLRHGDDAEPVLCRLR